MMLSSQPQKKIWVFVHIPKTAGTTLQREFHPKWFPKGAHIFGFGGFVHDDIKMREKEQKRRREKFAGNTIRQEVKLISGHDVFGLANDFGIPVQHFSFFRHPVDRMVSYFFHHQLKAEQNNESSGWSEIIAQFKNCEGFIANTDPMLEHYYSYLTMEENFAFEKRLRKKLGAYHPLQASQTQFRKLAEMTLPNACPEIYEEMKEKSLPRIEAAIPLISERFDESLQCLAKLMDKPIYPYERQRVNKSHDENRLEILDKLPELRRLHPEACEFYNEQVSRFEKICKETIKP